MHTLTREMGRERHIFLTLSSSEFTTTQQRESLRIRKARGRCCECVYAGTSCASAPTYVQPQHDTFELQYCMLVATPVAAAQATSFCSSPTMGEP